MRFCAIQSNEYEIPRCIAAICTISPNINEAREKKMFQEKLLYLRSNRQRLKIIIDAVFHFVFCCFRYQNINCSSISKHKLQVHVHVGK